MLQSRNILLRKLHFVFMAAACTIKDSDDRLWAGKTGRLGHFKHRGGQTKMILLAEGGKKLRLGLRKGERQGKITDLGRNHKPTGL
jgi:hypothetical protein